MDSRLYSRAQILAEIHITHRNNPDWRDFLTDNDLGVPFAVAITSGGAESLTDWGKACINDSWEYLCEMLALSPDEEYDSLDSMEEMFSLITNAREVVHNES